MPGGVTTPGYGATFGIAGTATAVRRGMTAVPLKTDDGDRQDMIMPAIRRLHRWRSRRTMAKRRWQKEMAKGDGQEVIGAEAQAASEEEQEHRSPALAPDLR